VTCLVQLCDEHLLSNCPERIDLDAGMAELATSAEVQALLEMYGEPLKALFVAYSTIDARSCPRWESAAAAGGYGLSFLRMWELMKDFELACVREGMQPQITRNQVSYIFMCANRVGLAADDKLEVVNFEEFKEVLCNLAVFFIPEGQRANIDELTLARGLQTLFSRMDASPGMMKITLHYGGTHTGKLRLVPDSTRRPVGWQQQVLKEEAKSTRAAPPSGYKRQGVRALHDEALPQDGPGTAPLYVEKSIKMHPGSPPWRGMREEDEMAAYAHSPAAFSSSPSAEREAIES